MLLPCLKVLKFKSVYRRHSTHGPRAPCRQNARVVQKQTPMSTSLPADAERSLGAQLRALMPPAERDAFAAHIDTARIMQFSPDAASAASPRAPNSRAVECAFILRARAHRSVPPQLLQFAHSLIYLIVISVL